MKVAGNFRIAACRAGVAAAVVLLAPVLGARGQVLELEGRAVVSGARILLQDLVRAGAALPEGWGERTIADAPAPKEVRSLSLTEVAQAMGEFEDMRSVVLRGRPVIQVTARHRSVDTVRIQEAIDGYVETRAEWRGRRFEVSSERLGLARVPEGALSVEVLRMREPGGGAPVKAELRLAVDGVEVDEGTVVVELLEMQPFWAATRPLQRGETLSADMLEVRWMVERDSNRFYPADHRIEGMELRRAVQTGQLLASGMLAEPVYARRGEMVRVTSQRGGLTVTLRAKALANGRRDERIMCENEQSGRKMLVKLVQPRAAILDDEHGDVTS